MHLERTVGGGGPDDAAGAHSPLGELVEGGFGQVEADAFLIEAHIVAELAVHGTVIDVGFIGGESVEVLVGGGVAYMKGVTRSVPTGAGSTLAELVLHRAGSRFSFSCFGVRAIRTPQRKDVTTS